MGDVEGLTAEEGILYALYLADGKVLGKTRLNKLIARLQRDGFPITNYFINAQMGPYDPEIDIKTSDLHDNGYIHKSFTSHPENDREDFQLTQYGTNYVVEVIVPKVKEYPFYDYAFDSFSSVRYEYLHSPILPLVGKVHNELYISEDISIFLTELNSIIEDLVSKFDQLESNYINYCYTTLSLLGTLEFTIRCLRKIQESYLYDKMTGKNNILVLSKQLSEKIKAYINKFGTIDRDCFDAKCCLHGINCQSRELDGVDYKFRSIEWNAKTYQILQPFSEEWELTNYMTEQEVSLFDSRLPTTKPMA